MTWVPDRLVPPSDGRCPVDEFLDGCPAKVSAQLIAVLDDVADAPPTLYSWFMGGATGILTSTML